MQEHIDNEVINKTSIIQESSKLETQEAGNPANTIKADKIRSKKTFEVDPDIAGILKFIKFSQKIDESKFVNTALENQIQLLLGDNWRESFKSYLNNR